MKCLLVVLASCLLGAGEPLVVNDHLGLDWRQEPVSFDVDLDPARPVATVGLDHSVSQVEVLAGDCEAARKVRIWTTVDLKGPGQLRFQIGAPEPSSSLLPKAVTAEGPVPLVEWGNALLRLRSPLPGAMPTTAWAEGETRYPELLDPLMVPGPIAGLSLDGTAWYGTGYLDCRRRIEAIAWRWCSGPVFQELVLTYRFTGRQAFTATLRLFAGKPWVSLTEDSDLGDDSRVVFLPTGGEVRCYLLPSDASFDRWLPLGGRTAVSDGAEDFITITESRCLARLVIWSQFNYFRAKQEHLALALADPAGDLALGVFLCRPDRWTRAKVNHIDLYERPQRPGIVGRSSRGRTGLGDSVPQPAFESWLTDGHRETAWYLRRIGTWKDLPNAVAQGQGALPPAATSQDPFITRAHVTEGIWNLDRINRQCLSWNADGSTPSADDQRPCGGLGFATDLMTVMQSTRGRCGLMRFNGSNPNIRHEIPPAAKALLAWAKANPDQKGATALQKVRAVSTRQAGPALLCLMAMDDSAYPGPRAMLPWSDPEALNPFYQGMENMNFNTDRYKVVQFLAAALKELGWPEAGRAWAYVQGQYRGQVERYVYPQSGCWEESHTYAGSILAATRETGRALRDCGLADPFADPAVQAAHAFWPRVLSPPDPGFAGKRGVPPIGDHGGPTYRSKTLREVIPDFLAAGTPAAQRTAAELAWLIQGEGGSIDDLGVTPQRPPAGSAWLQGYGSVLRSVDDQQREAMIVVRAGQSWGHHHMDKGSLWGWMRNVHFFGDAAWGSPPGGHYWNPYKQGPAGHTGIEFVGINNWPLPCKYPAAWIADERYTTGADWCVARCRYPYNPPLDLTRSTAPALVNGYDRCVLFIHPDLLIVRDEVETTCPTVWRLHSYQVDGTTVQGNRAVLAAPQGVTGDLAIVHPPGVVLTTVARHDLPAEGGRIPDEPFGAAAGAVSGKDRQGKEMISAHDTRSLVLRWDMPADTSATWVFAARDRDQAPLAVEVLDDRGRVLRLKHADGREVVACLSAVPFAWQGAGVDFRGRAAAVVRQAGGRFIHVLASDRCTVE